MGRFSKPEHEDFPKELQTLLLFLRIPKTFAFYLQKVKVLQPTQNTIVKIHD